MPRPIRFLLLQLILVSSLRAASPPAAPTFLEPEKDGQIVHAADVHMVTAPFADPDNDKHLCTDWEIRAGDDVVWQARCAVDSEKIHIHLGDGAFTGPRAGRRELAEGVVHTLAARHRDDSGDPATEWSPWTERLFLTSIPANSPPMSIRDVLADPAPQWTLTPPPGASLHLRTPDREDLLVIDQNGIGDSAPQPLRSAVRILLTAGTSAWDLPESELTFEDENGARHTIYLPALRIEPGDSARLWISANGGTHHGEAGARVPDFETILRGAPVPWAARQRGFVVEAAAGDLQLPVGIAFARDPGDGPDAPLYYVAELYGEVKAVTRAGAVHTFATNLLDIMPTDTSPAAASPGWAASPSIRRTATYTLPASTGPTAPSGACTRASCGFGPRRTACAPSSSRRSSPSSTRPSRRPTRSPTSPSVPTACSTCTSATARSTIPHKTWPRSAARSCA